MARQKAALEEDYAELGADLVACRTNLTTTTDSLSACQAMDAGVSARRLLRLGGSD
jgi:hypothetical protein